MASWPVRFYRATIAYDGSAYFGWQWQNDRPTVQGVLERALTTITGRSVRITASGRTDAGVHALGQVVSFAVATRLDPGTLGRALNANLPEDVVVRQVALAPDGFHAVRDAVSKRYRYVIQDGGTRDVFSRRYAWRLPWRLDPEPMAAAGRLLVGEHDFAAYQTSGSKRVTTVRRVSALTVRRVAASPWDRLEIEVEANGFLYNMVRNMVGTLMVVGRKDQPPAWVADVLASRDRRRAGPTAPPQGLFLVSVDYEDPQQTPRRNEW